MHFCTSNQHKMKHYTFLISLILVVFSFSLSAKSYYFYVQLKDKNNSPYSLDKASDYLSERALERRAHFKIPIDSTDLPVNPQYIKAITSDEIHVHATTKWLNGVTLMLSDSAKIETVKKLPFVNFVQYTGITYENLPPLEKTKQSPTADYDYGVASRQIQQLNGQILHQNGYKGENIHIAVLDAGFLAVDRNPVFSSLISEGRLLGTKDFVNPISDIYAEDVHGAFVLSTMAAEVDGTYVGTAPKASYHLIRTEAAKGEYLCEPDFWISGIEYADSAGVDLATTSLGYTTFDDASMNYKYSDLDGKTIRASIAANMAFKKGIFLINSAGNEGSNSWRHISVPADADGVITVGSVNKDSVYTSFSSIGPSADGRVKPEIVAIGQASALVSSSGNTMSGNGTSFSAPIMAGVSACFLQAAKSVAPQLSLQEIYEMIFESAHLFDKPSNQLGYGIADFKKAYSMLLSSSLKQVRPSPTSNKNTFKVIIAENQENIVLNLLPEHYLRKGTISLFSVSGQLILQSEIVNNRIILDTKNLQKGVYLIHID